MSRTTVTTRILGALFLGLVAVPSGANAFWTQNDAGTGTDAGNSWSTATALPDYGSYAGTLLEHDTDVYVVNQPSTSPVCVQFNYTAAESAHTITARASSGGANKDATLPVAAGATVTGGLATNAYDFAGLATTLQNPELDGRHPYTFSLARQAAVSVPYSASVGHSLSNEVPLQGPCTAGTMSGLNVARLDAYDLGTLGAGSTVVASLAATASDLVLQVVDDNGTAVATTTVNGVTTATIPTSGHYSMTVVRTDVSVQDVEYLVGTVVSPPCQPTC